MSMKALSHTYTQAHTRDSQALKLYTRKIFVLQSLYGEETRLLRPNCLPSACQSASQYLLSLLLTLLLVNLVPNFVRHTKSILLPPKLRKNTVMVVTLEQSWQVSRKAVEISKVKGNEQKIVVQLDTPTI